MIVIYEGEYLYRDSLEGALLDQKIEEFYDNDKFHKNIYFINRKKVIIIKIN